MDKEYCAYLLTQVSIATTDQGKVPKWVMKTGEL